jgi:hypothetical protein
MMLPAKPSWCCLTCVLRAEACSPGDNAYAFDVTREGSCVAAFAAQGQRRGVPQAMCARRACALQHTVHM